MKDPSFPFVPSLPGSIMWLIRVRQVVLIAMPAFWFIQPTS